MSKRQPPATAAVPSLPNINTNRPRAGTFERPGSVRINVQGAFIVDDDTPGSPPRQHSDTKDIRLPYHKTQVSHIAVDIGGSLAKVVYFSRDPNGNGGKLNFKNFETERINDLIDFMDRLMNGSESVLLPEQDESTKEEIKRKRRRDGLHVMATGGGAHKFYDKLKDRLGVEIYREDEMECLIVGLDFFVTEIPEEVFTYSEADPMQFAESRAAIYPYLLVNIGSGVSMIKVSGPQQFERIGGSSLGGGTLWGLLSLLTEASSFDEMLGMAEHGDNTAVDMLVGDIYGTDYGRIGLKSTTIASSFGKVFKKSHEDPNSIANKSNAVTDGNTSESIPPTTAVDRRKRFRQEDISRSLLYAISNNIGQIAYLQAQHHNLEHIYFGGSFIRGHHQTMNTLSYAIKFWSKGTKKAYFLRHEGYLGSVGAFLRTQPMRGWGRRYSTGEADREAGFRPTMGKGEKKKEAA